MSEARHAGAPRRRPGRLSRSAEFDRVYRQGRSVANRYLVLYAFPRAGGEPGRVGLSVGRKVGGAVERNRVKRLLREACTEHADALPKGHDVVVVARTEAGGLASERGLAGIGDALEDLLATVRRRSEEAG
ncbi:MAG TPA: ribonuclease P protein component [Solirubrobacteraceae bacterium]